MFECFIYVVNFLFLECESVIIKNLSFPLISFKEQCRVAHKIPARSESVLVKTSIYIVDGETVTLTRRSGCQCVTDSQNETIHIYEVVNLYITNNMF